jgi:predicted dehydrogenase
MLADESIDIVDICSPPWLHAEQAVAAARAGKHVLLEKPIALSWDDAKAVRDAVRKAKVQACVCFEVRFSRQFQTVRSVVEQGCSAGSTTPRWTTTTHRALVRTVSVEREEAGRRVEPPQRRVPCHGRAADGDGRVRRGGDELRDALRQRDVSRPTNTTRRR